MDSTSPPIPLDELLGHRAWVRSLARSLVRDPAAADDLEQQTWLAALRSPPSERATVRAWFSTVVRNFARERGRSEGRRSRREAVVARAEGITPTVDVVARGESHKRVVLAVMDLPDPYRETVLLRFFEELPPRAVAARMDTPVETVRTRTRRALALLRKRLDEGEGEGRAAWVHAIAPLLLPLDSAPGSEHAGGKRMLTIRLAAVAALVIAFPAGFAWLGGDGGAPAGDDDTPAEVADASPGEEEPRRRGRGVVAPPSRPGGDAKKDTAGDGEPPKRATWGPPVKPLPKDTDASVYADGKLALRVSIDPPVPHAGKPFHIVATFRNVGTGPARFHVDEHAGLVPFPRLVFRAADGRLFAPVAPPFQSEAVRGLSGDVVRLEAGQQHAVRTRVTDFVEIDAETARGESRPLSQRRAELPPGDYTLTAFHAKADDTVPFAGEGFSVKRESVAGLWTGELDAPEIAWRLAPPNEATLTLRGPEKLVPGGSMLLTLVIANPSQAERTLTGAFALRRSEKGGPAFAAWFRFGEDAVPGKPDHAATLTLAAGETRTCRIDVGELLWERLPTRFGRYGGAPWPFSRDYPALWVTCGRRGEDGKGMAGSNTVFVSLMPAPDLAESGLALRIEIDGLHDEAPWVGVHLRNGSSGEIVVPKRLRTPRRIAVTFEPASGRRPLPREVTVIDREPFRALQPTDLVRLGPGEELFARVGLDPESLADHEGPGYLRVHWANLDGCERAGFEDLRPPVGRLESGKAGVALPAR